GIEIELVGLTEDVMHKIRNLAGGPAIVQELPAKPQAVAPPAPARKSDLRPGDELPSDERQLFQHLSNELRRLRQAAVHDVLGIPAGADPEQVRRGWKALGRRHHPDLVARPAPPAITPLAAEPTLLSNRADHRLPIAFP